MKSSYSWVVSSVEFQSRTHNDATFPETMTERVIVARDENHIRGRKSANKKKERKKKEEKMRESVSRIYNRWPLPAKSWQARKRLRLDFRWQAPEGLNPLRAASQRRASLQPL